MKYDYWAAVHSFERILVSSDWHLSPTDHLKYEHKEFLRMCAEKGTRGILNGDILDIIIWGIEAYRNSPIIFELKQYIPPQGIDYIMGNHEASRAWMAELFADKNTVRISKQLELKLGPHQWHFEHGDRWAMDWGFFRWFYTWFAENAARINRPLWLRFCKWRGWIKYDELRVPQAMEAITYNKWKVVNWARALDWAAQKGTNFGMGHTHSQVIIDADWVTLEDDGNMDISSNYVEITEKEVMKKSILPKS